jgi:hypothetical protein
VEEIQRLNSTHGCGAMTVAAVQHLSFPNFNLQHKGYLNLYQKASAILLINVNLVYGLENCQFLFRRTKQNHLSIRCFFMNSIWYNPNDTYVAFKRFLP